MSVPRSGGLSCVGGAPWFKTDVKTYVEVMEAGSKEEVKQRLLALTVDAVEVQGGPEIAAGRATCRHRSLADPAHVALRAPSTCTRSQLSFSQ